MEILVALIIIVLISGIVVAQSEPSTSNEKVLGSSSSEQLDLEVYRPFIVRITDGNVTITTSTVYKDPARILENAGFPMRQEDEFSYNYVESVDDTLVGLELIIERATPVGLNIRGEKTNILTLSKTVGELLLEKGVVLGPNDKARPSLATAITPNLLVAVNRVGSETITVEEELEFSRDFIDNANVKYGTNTVKTPGKNGKAKVTYQITFNDGVEVSRKKVLSVTLTAATNEVVIRGTKGKPSSKGPLSAEQIQFLGSCEAGMNPTRNSGNGYYGAFQFSIGTWNAMGTGYARADQAPLDVQIQAVQKLLSGSSIFGQFPGCANKMVALGLL